jgi:hypothetical protein
MFLWDTTKEDIYNHNTIEYVDHDNFSCAIVQYIMP